MSRPHEAAGRCPRDGPRQLGDTAARPRTPDGGARARGQGLRGPRAAERRPTATATAGHGRAHTPARSSAGPCGRTPGTPRASHAPPTRTQTPTPTPEMRLFPPNYKSQQPRARAPTGARSTERLQVPAGSATVQGLRFPESPARSSRRALRDM